MKRIIYILLLLLLPVLLSAQHNDVRLNSEFVKVVFNDTVIVEGYYNSVRVETSLDIIHSDNINDLGIDYFPVFPEIGKDVEKNKIYVFKNKLYCTKEKGKVEEDPDKSDKYLKEIGVKF